LPPPPPHPAKARERMAPTAVNAARPIITFTS
jgi:hypothetical protein